MSTPLFAVAFCAYPPEETRANTRWPSGVLPTTSIPGIKGNVCAER